MAGPAPPLPDMNLVVAVPDPVALSPRDDVLWAAARRGDGDAFAQLYDRYVDEIYNYLFRRTGDWSQAEDLTSTVFLTAFKRHTDARIEEGKVGPWLYGVATNVLRNQRRSVRRYRHMLERLPRPRIDDELYADAADRLDAAARMRPLIERLKVLPRRQQDVVALCLWADLSHEETAAALGIPVGTVKSRLARARAALGGTSPAEPDIEIDAAVVTAEGRS